MIIYILIYILLFLLSIHTYNRPSKVYLYLTGLFLILFAGLRGKDVSSDYSTYIEFFLDIKQQGELKLFSLVEPSYIIISYLLPTVRAVMIVFALLAVSIKLYAINTMTPFVFFSITLLFSSFFLVQEMNQIRAAVATGILLLSIPSIFDKKLFSFCVLIIVAMLFHYSAIVFFPLYFLSNSKIQRFYFLVIPAAYLLNLLGIGFLDILKHIHINFVESKLEAYNELYSMGMYTKINIYNPIVILRIAIIYTLLVNSKQLSLKNRYFIVLMKSYIISIAVLVLFSNLPVFSLRVSDIFGIVEILLIPFFFYIYKPKSLIVLFILLFSSLILCVDLFYNKFLNPYTL